jgi:hypothetical protein
MSSGIVWRIYVGFVADIDIKILEVCPLGPGMPFLDSDTCAKEGGLFIYVRVFFLYDAIHGWMMGRMDGWMDESRDQKSFTKNDHNIFYYMY